MLEKDKLQILLVFKVKLKIRTSQMIIAKCVLSIPKKFVYRKSVIVLRIESITAFLFEN